MGMCVSHLQYGYFLCQLLLYEEWGNKQLLGKLLNDQHKCTQANDVDRI